MALPRDATVQRPLEFGTKAETLARLRPILHSAEILPLQIVERKSWEAGSDVTLKAVERDGWLKTPLIVRSSARHEDKAGASQAGRFLSLPNVLGLGDLKAAIDRVFASYDETDPTDQVLIQPMLQAVDLSGVVFTSDPNSGSPYLVINYETEGDTAAVTGGKQSALETHLHLKGENPSLCPAPLRPLLTLAEELESIFGLAELDIEFTFAHGKLYLLQVRPLVGGALSPRESAAHRARLQTIADKIAVANRPHPYLRGRRTVYGVMPDWNPAEIIGVRPRPLALSLYRNLITDSVWAYQRHNYGYRNLRSFPLIVSFHGLPYVDVRVSFNSFVPGDIEDGLADRMVDAYIDQLLAAPTLHDKVEFEIVHSCYSFDLQDRLKRLRDRGFSPGDLDCVTESLRRLTNRVVHAESGLWKQDSAKIEVLQQRQQTILNADMDELGKVYWLLEDCKRYGTLPFAGLARAGFIAVQMLKSLVTVGILTREQYDCFMAGLDTVSGRMAEDFRNLSKAAFLERYGHLRPGTYDILSPRYDEAPDRYLDWSKQAAPAIPHQPFALSLAQIRQIDKLLAEHKLDMDVVRLFDFIQASIQGREHSKFVFTKSLSDSLKLLTVLGARHGFDAEAMSYFDAALIEELYVSAGNAAEIMESSIANGRIRYAQAKQIVLPPLIQGPDDVFSFSQLQAEPNFITQGKAEGPVTGHDRPLEELKDAIVMIPSADPGFDWLFSCGIRGFITAYGGVNSHMAIRAGELQLPAVIGAGELLFNQWRGARRLGLDCANRRVDVIQ